MGWEGWWGAWWVWEVLAQHDVGFQLFGHQPFGRVSCRKALAVRRSSAMAGEVRSSATAEMRFWRFVGRTAIRPYPPGSRMPRTYRQQPQVRGLLIAEYR